MIILKPLPGNVPIIVWRRNAWTSMPHARYSDEETYCGRYVTIGDGINAIALTQIKAENFTVVGCGICIHSLVSGMRKELDAVKPNIRQEWQDKLKTLKWSRATAN